jgi:hypothetical protein
MLRRIAVIVGYLALACLIVVLTVGLVAYGDGYSYNFHQHRIVRTGIVIIQSAPGGASVSLDGHLTSKKTAYRQSFEAGNYGFVIAKEGFHTWQKTLQVLAGEVTLVQYVILVPNDLAPAKALATSQIVNQSLSRDHRHVAYITTGAEAGVYVDDIGSDTPTKVYSFPADPAATVPAETLSSVSWSDDASHLMVQSQRSGATVTRVMAANGSGVTDVTDQYHYDFTSARFSNGNWQQVYWLAPDGLRRLDLGKQTVSDVLVGQVKQFAVTSDRVLCVESTTLGESLWSLDNHDRKQELVAALPASDRYSLAYTAYQGTNYLAVVPSSTQTGTLYSNIYGDSPLAQTLAHDVANVSFSPDGHLVNFSGPTSETTYDIDESTAYGMPISHSFAVSGLTGVPDWFDNFHLLSVQNGQLVWSEYDGANSVNLGVPQAGLAGFGSADAKSVYYYQAVPSGTQLIRLTIKP